MALISITRALSEIKNLDDQIQKATVANYVHVTKGNGDRKVVVGSNAAVTVA